MGKLVRRSAVVVGALALVPCAVTVVVRHVAVDTRWPVAYVAASPYLLLAALASAALFLLARAWIGVALALVVGLVIASTQLPLYVADAAPADDGETVVVMTANLQLGLADAAAVVDIVRARGVDILALQELTPEAVAALRAAALGDAMPYSVATPASGASGNGLWSRTPLEASAVPVDHGHPPVAATTTIAGREVIVTCVHPVAPFPSDAARWSAEINMLREWWAQDDRAAIVAGDFNATFDHRQFRDLLDIGLHDAVEQSGAGYLPTYPTDRRYPPLIAIDHVLTRGPVAATRVDTIEVAGTDHLALLATLVVAPVP